MRCRSFRVWTFGALASDTCCHELKGSIWGCSPGVLGSDWAPNLTGGWTTEKPCFQGSDDAADGWVSHFGSLALPSCCLVLVSKEGEGRRSTEKPIWVGSSSRRLAQEGGGGPLYMYTISALGGGFKYLGFFFFPKYMSGSWRKRGSQNIPLG